MYNCNKQCFKFTWNHFERNIINVSTTSSPNCSAMCSPKDPYLSYKARFFSSDKMWLAWLIFLNCEWKMFKRILDGFLIMVLLIKAFPTILKYDFTISSASALSGFLSGWYFKASLRYFFLISSFVDVFGMSNNWYKLSPVRL